MKNEKFKIKGNIKMVDISSKNSTKRIAVAQARVYMKKTTLNRLIKGKLPKGDVLICAKITGILAAKKTDELIPLCHPLAIDKVDLSFQSNSRAGFIKITSEVISYGKTGVEMEALTAVSVACLTVYDMCKSVDRGITISDIKLLKKSGGKSEKNLK